MNQLMQRLMIPSGISDGIRQILAQANAAIFRLREILRQNTHRNSDIYFVLKVFHITLFIFSIIFSQLFSQPIPLEGLLFTMVFLDSPEARKVVISYLTHLQFVKIDIGGNDLKAMGFSPSKKFANVLREILRAVLDGEVGHRRTACLSKGAHEILK